MLALLISFRGATVLRFGPSCPATPATPTQLQMEKQLCHNVSLLIYTLKYLI